MAGSTGKGDRRRKEDNQKYRDNHDKIFGKKKKGEIMDTNFEKMSGGLALKRGVVVIGWVLTTLNSRWVCYSIDGKLEKGVLYHSEESAKNALLKHFE